MPRGILELGKDASTEALLLMDYAHHEVHDGKTYEANVYNGSLANAASLELVLSFPEGDEEFHATFDMECGGAASFKLSEAPTGVTGGSAVTPVNVNRVDGAISSVAGVKDPTSITADGTSLREWHSGVGGGIKTPGTSRGDVEWVLKSGTEYLFKVTNLSGGTVPASIVTRWYEHKRKR